jgi:hypothetical protein
VTTTYIELPECEGEGAFSEAKEGHTIATAFRNYQAPVFS